MQAQNVVRVIETNCWMMPVHEHYGCVLCSTINSIHIKSQVPYMARFERVKKLNVWIMAKLSKCTSFDGGPIES